MFYNTTSKEITYGNTISMAGNITGGNLLTGGLISATANITGGNITTGGVLKISGVSAYIDVSGTGFIQDAGAGEMQISTVAGKPLIINTSAGAYAWRFGTAGNLTLPNGGTLSGTGNITAGYFFGNGSQLTGITGTYGNSNVVANLAALGSNPVSTTGNVTGGNILTGGIISATGNIFAGNAVFSGNLSVAGNVTYINSNVITINDVAINLANNAANVTQINGGGIELGPQGTPYVTFLYNTAANTFTSNVGLSAVANITGGNVLTGGLISATSTITSAANITGGNILTGGLISATGNITGNYFLGNGSQLTGIVASGTLGSTVDNFTGNGSQVAFVLSTAPSSKNVTFVNIDGVEQLRTAYSLTGSTITFSSPPASGASIEITTLSGSVGSNISIASGTSNVSIGAANANVTVSVGGTSNVAVFATTGEYVTGVISASGNIVSAGNLLITSNVGIGTNSPTQTLMLGSGFIQTGQGVGGGGGVRFPYSSDAAGRTWRARSDITGYGDFGLEQSTTQTGDSYATQLLITQPGVLQFNSGYGSAATAYGCRAWCQYNQSPTIIASGNMSSITIVGTGDVRLNFATALVDANYAAVATTNESGGVPKFCNSTQPSTVNIRIVTFNANQTTGWFEYNSVAIFR
jgi:hypothetical protein